MQLGVVGDIHLCWTDADVSDLDARGYAGVLVTGDLPGRRHVGTLRVARGIAALRTPVIAIPGNHDGTAPLQVLAEAVGFFRDRPWHVRAQRQRVAELDAALHPHVWGGYSLHELGEVQVLVARPHAMDGRGLTFRPQLASRYGIRTEADSAARLRALVDRATKRLVVLCHNGPYGLGVDGPWGLLRRRLDNGDRDLTDMIAYAGDRVLAVVGGHAHHGRDRPWRVERNGVLYVNAARVPRVFRQDGQTWHHHVRLTIEGDRAHADEVLVPR